MSTSDDIQALAYRTSIRTRAAYKRSANAAMAGNEASRTALDSKWDSVVQWMAEMDAEEAEGT